MPTVDWEQVSHYSFLDEFHLLQDTRNDVRDKPWTRPAIRETMRQARRLDRAREELTRCNIEAHRLHTSICDEDAHFTRILNHLKSEGSQIYGAVAEYCERRRNINARHLKRLQQLYALKGFTGTPSPGARKGDAAIGGVLLAQTDKAAESAARVGRIATRVETGGSRAEGEVSVETRISDDEGDEDDEGEAEVDALVDFVCNLAM